MNKRRLGKSGITVSDICLGTMTFGEELGTGASRETSQKVYERFVEAGGNFIDTANIYTLGTSERMLGDFIAELPALRRSRLTVATKLAPFPWRWGRRGYR